MRTWRSRSALALAICLASVPAFALPTPSPAPSGTPAPIALVINGQRLALKPPPRFVKNHLLVPVRRIVSALGLDFEQLGERIIIHVGDRTVAFSIGSRHAQIDGQNVRLEAVPVIVKNVLYAPLRFFTQAIGAQAHFERKTNAVVITADIIGTSGNGRTVHHGVVEQRGTVTAVDLDSDPATITLSFVGTTQTIPIAPDAVILLHDVNADVSVPAQLQDVRPGYFATVRLAKKGLATRIVAAYGSRSGRVAAVSGDLIVLADGHVIVPSRDTIVSIDGKAASADRAKVGDRATIRYNVRTDEVQAILLARAATAQNAAAAGAAITDVSLDTNSPLRTGETVMVRMHATPGGAASFDIGPFLSDVAMAERRPGDYVGSYTVPPGVNFVDVPVTAHLQIGAASLERTAPNRLSAATTPPGVVAVGPRAGAVVSSSRPAIYARFATTAVPVNPSSVVLRVDGHDVTPSCVRTPNFIEYRPHLAYGNGPMHVQVQLADMAGNVTTKSWTFTISSP
ncbi:MAG: copper amine oxidase N-terminal domain-containing protein [Bacillati bacterium]